jgi:hypothetical protein
MDREMLLRNLIELALHELSVKNNRLTLIFSRTRIDAQRSKIHACWVKIPVG